MDEEAKLELTDCDDDVSPVVECSELELGDEDITLEIKRIKELESENLNLRIENYKLRRHENLEELRCKLADTKKDCENSIEFEKNETLLAKAETTALKKQLELVRDELRRAYERMDSMKVELEAKNRTTNVAPDTPRGPIGQPLEPDQ